MPTELPALFTRVLNEHSAKSASPADQADLGRRPSPGLDQLADGHLVWLLDWASRSPRVARLGYRVYGPDEVTTQRRRLTELKAHIDGMAQAFQDSLKKHGRPKDSLTDAVYGVAACLYDAGLGSWEDVARVLGMKKERGGLGKKRTVGTLKSEVSRLKRLPEFNEALAEVSEPVIDTFRSAFHTTPHG
jgi:hypothetical protein